uniref:hypothetical protein n=1 Tax=uncultured Vibrio sp. TaxID=114054 RepID=UPI002622860C
MTDTALVGGICVDIRKSMSRFVDAYNFIMPIEMLKQMIRSYKQYLRIIKFLTIVMFISI